MLFDVPNIYIFNSCLEKLNEKIVKMRAYRGNWNMAKVGAVDFIGLKVDIKGLCYFEVGWPPSCCSTCKCIML